MKRNLWHTLSAAAPAASDSRPSVSARPGSEPFPNPATRWVDELFFIQPESTASSNPPSDSIGGALDLQRLVAQASAASNSHHPVVPASVSARPDSDLFSNPATRWVDELFFIQPESAVSSNPPSDSIGGALDLQRLVAQASAASNSHHPVVPASTDPDLVSNPATRWIDELFLIQPEPVVSSGKKGGEGENNVSRDPFTIEPR
ncbi:hypothetical protein BT69DRAFT_1303325 [Atractiella rhizophila]|nr:hypothetical protein BT69DRAFT_1303325 [Atractiella rhizophila]